MIEVTCAIIIKKNQILVAQRSERMNMPLKWEFPGGKINENESNSECIIREIKEELGITVKLTQQLPENIYDYGNKVIKLIPFICEYSEGKIVLTEHKSILWVNPEELKGFDWCEADIVQKVAKNISSV